MDADDDGGQEHSSKDKEVHGVKGVSVVDIVSAAASVL